MHFIKNFDIKNPLQKQKDNVLYIQKVTLFLNTNKN